MSFMLPDVSLANAAVGNTGKILLQNMGISAGGVSASPAFLNKPATLYFHNDSGCGLGMTLKDSGNQFNLPAGAWVPIPIGPGESEVDYIVKYVLPNPPVSTLMIAYYAPGEPIPQTSTLGNSPVGIGGSVQTSSVQTLSNEGNAAGTLVIDIGDTAISQLVKFFTDHFAISVDQSGVAHTVLKGNTTGNPLQLGQAGDISEVLGQLTVDQLLTAALGIAISASGLSVLGGTVTDTLRVTGATEVDGNINSGANDIVLNAATGHTVTIQVNGVNILKIDGANAALQGAFGFALGSGGVYRFRNGGTMQAISNFSGSGSGTYNHNFGSAPFDVIPIVDVAGSATQGFDSVTSTQVHVTLGAALSFRAFCWS